VNEEIATAAAFNQAATSASFNGGKAHGFFKEMVEKLVGK